MLPRRALLRLGGLAAAGAALGWSQRARAAGKTEAVLLSCMDYRLMDDLVRYMDGRKLTDSYDHLIIAGASLGVTSEKYPAWAQTFWDHVGLASDLHHIKRVIVIDHRDCGGYKLLLGPGHAKDRATETAAHAAELGKLRAAIKARNPALEVETLLMALDGTVEALA
jgi:carbonic anhydrase